MSSVFNLQISRTKFNYIWPRPISFMSEAANLQEHISSFLLYDKHSQSGCSVLCYAVIWSYFLIIGIAPSIVIFWTGFSYWYKNYSVKATLLLGWSHRYNSTVIITNWLTGTKYQFLKCNRVFSLSGIYFVFRSSSTLFLLDFTI